MTEDTYNRMHAAIQWRIQQHSRRLSDGRLLFPRCLAADYRELEKLESNYNNNEKNLD